MISPAHLHVRPTGRTWSWAGDIELTPIGVAVNGSRHVHRTPCRMRVAPRSSTQHDTESAPVTPYTHKWPQTRAAPRHSCQPARRKPPCGTHYSRTDLAHGRGGRAALYRAALYRAVVVVQANISKIIRYALNPLTSTTPYLARGDLPRVRDGREAGLARDGKRLGKGQRREPALGRVEPEPHDPGSPVDDVLACIERNKQPEASSQQ